MPENFSTSTLQCNDINVYGSYLRSLCGNEDGFSYNGGHLHNSILKAFIHTLTQSTNITAYIIPDNERHSFLAGQWSMSSIPAANSHDNLHVNHLWVIMLLPDNTFGHDTHSNAICIDIANTCTHYFCVDNTHEDVITYHNTRLDHLLTNCSTPDRTK